MTFRDIGVYVVLTATTSLVRTNNRPIGVPRADMSCFVTVLYVVVFFEIGVYVVLIHNF